MPNFSAIRTSSANDRARIFCMTPLRWILTVNSVVPNLAAICLLSRPLTTSSSTSRSRCVNESYRARCSATSVWRFRFVRSRSMAWWIASSNAWSRNGLGQKLNCTGFHRLHRHRDVAMAGNENDRNRRSGRSQFQLEIESARSGQTHVEDKACRRVWPLEC
jgi:hypothetical protein